MRATPPSSPIDPVDRLRAETSALIDRYGYTKLVIGTGLCAVPGCSIRRYDVATLW